MTDIIEIVARAIHSRLSGKGDGWEDAYTTDKYPNVRNMFVEMSKAALAALADAPLDEKAFAVACIETIMFSSKTSATNAFRASLRAYLQAIGGQRE